jgi:hypothetical protein
VTMQHLSPVVARGREVRVDRLRPCRHVPFRSARGFPQQERCYRCNDREGRREASSES